MKNLRRSCGLLALGLAGVTATTPLEAKAEMTEIQCLQAQNAWIEDCLDGWDGIWTSLTGNLDECVAGFDTAYPQCVNVGVSAEEGAEEIHEAYGPAGEIIGGGLGIVGGMVGDLFECAAGGGVILYVGSEAGSIYITGEDYGGYSVDDETIQEMVDACYQTAINSGVFATAIVAPELMAAYITGHLGWEVWECYDACINAPDPHACTETCYDMGAEAAALLAILYAGHVATEALPPEMLAPEFMGYNLRPGGGVATEYDGCESLDPIENNGRGECMDEFYDNFRWRMEDPSLGENEVTNHNFSECENAAEQFELLDSLVSDSFGGEFVEVTTEPMSGPELQTYLEGLEPGSHALVVGEGIPGEPPHAIYVFRGPGGVSPAGGGDFPWPNYHVNVYVPPGGSPPPPATPPVGPPFDPASGGNGGGAEPPPDAPPSTPSY